MFEGKTTGTPISLLVRKKDQLPEIMETLFLCFGVQACGLSFTKNTASRLQRGGVLPVGKQSAVSPARLL
ncbi:MAG: hypothetical protein ACLRSR_06145 [[Ruminococcus] lactaris]